MRLSRLVLISVVLGSLLLPAAMVEASAPGGVINNVLAAKIELSADGSFKVHNVIVGFRRGTVAFESLTQVSLAKAGKYTLSLEIVDPSGRRCASVNPAAIQAGYDNWIHSELAKWRVTFSTTGTYQFVVRVNGTVIGQFPIIVTS